MSQPHESFRTYEKSTVRSGEPLPQQNARLERERAMRYLDQAEDAMRLALECFRRAESYEKGAP